MPQIEKQLEEDELRRRRKATELRDEDSEATALPFKCGTCQRAFRCIARHRSVTTRPKVVGHQTTPRESRFVRSALSITFRGGPLFKFKCMRVCVCGKDIHNLMVKERRTLFYHCMGT